MGNGLAWSRLFRRAGYVVRVRGACAEQNHTSIGQRPNYLNLKEMLQRNEQ
jgi:hypothetical protein